MENDIGLELKYLNIFVLTRRMIKIASTVALTLSILFTAAAQQAGSLDPTFGAGGKVLLPLPGGWNAIALQTDGKIVVVGGQAIARLNTDGVLDTTFSQDGWDSISGVDLTDVKIQSDGKIVCVGRLGICARFDTNGALDTAFGNSGFINFANCFFNSCLPRLVIQSSGRIIILVLPSSVILMHGYTPNGILDVGFGVGGIVQTIPYSSGVTDESEAYDLVLQADEKIVVVGKLGYYDPLPDEWYGGVGIFRYTPDGILDPTFYGDGIFGSANQWHELPTYEHVCLTGTGNLALLYKRTHSDYICSIETFINGGSNTETAGANLTDTLWVNGIEWESDAKAIAVGLSLDTASHFKMVRCRRNGLDSTFGTNGVVTTDFGFIGQGSESAYSVAIQPDGRIIVVGKAGGNLALARYNNCGGSVISSTACSGTCDGSLSVNTQFGVVPFNYVWSTGETTAMIDSLCPGTYTLTLTDSSGCNTNYSATITEAHANAYFQTSPLCFGSCDGSARVTFSNGVPPYTYQWSNGESTDTAFALCAGICTVQVTDSNLCVDTASITVNQPSIVNPFILGADVLCHGECSGLVIDSITGGTPPYSFTLCSGGNIDSLCPGNYCVVISDAHGCDTSASITIAEPPPLVLTIISVQHPSCSNCYDGSLVFSVAGGTPLYSMNWFPHFGQISNDSILHLRPGVYGFIAIDMNGCMDTIMDTLVALVNAIPHEGVGESIFVSYNLADAALTIYGLHSGDFIEIFNPLGVRVFSSGALQTNYTIDCSVFSGSSYLVRVITTERVYVKKIMIR